MSGSTKEIVVRFDAEAFAEYNALVEAVSEGKKARGKPTYHQLLESIRNTVKNLRNDPYHGDLIPRKNILKKQ